MCLADAFQTMHLAADVLGNPLAHAIANVFAEIQWVEEEIDACQARWPEHADAIDRLFGLRVHCAAPPGHWSERLSRLHIRELAQRIAEGKDLRPPTRAEMLYALSEMSQVAPFRSAAFVLYARIFREAFPEDAEQIFGDILPAHERIVLEEDVEALHRKLIRSLFQNNRVLDAKQTQKEG